VIFFLDPTIKTTSTLTFYPKTDIDFLILFHSAGDLITMDTSGSNNLHGPFMGGSWSVRIYETGYSHPVSDFTGDLAKVMSFPDAKNTTFKINNVQFKLPKIASNGTNVFQVSFTAQDFSHATYFCLNVFYNLDTGAITTTDDLNNNANNAAAIVSSLPRSNGGRCQNPGNCGNCVDYARCMANGKLPTNLGTCAGKHSVANTPGNAGHAGCVLFRFNSCCKAFPCKDTQCPCHAEYINSAGGNSYSVLQANWSPGVCNSATIKKNDIALFPGNSIWCP